MPFVVNPLSLIPQTTPYVAIMPLGLPSDDMALRL